MKYFIYALSIFGFTFLLSCGSGIDQIDFRHKSKKMEDELQAERKLRVHLQTYIDSVLGGNASELLWKLGLDSVSSRDTLIMDTIIYVRLTTVSPQLEVLESVMHNAMRELDTEGVNIYIEKDKLILSFEEKLLFSPRAKRLKQTGKEVLKQLTKELISRPKLQIMVVGHIDRSLLADGSGVSAHWTLSNQRALAVGQMLMKHGLQAKRLTIAAGGSAHPLASNFEEAGRYVNRRTEIIITPAE